MKLIEKHDSGLADTLAIMSNPAVQKILTQSEKDIHNKKLIPLDRV